MCPEISNDPHWEVGKGNRNFLLFCQHDLSYCKTEKDTKRKWREKRSTCTDVFLRGSASGTSTQVFCPSFFGAPARVPVKITMNCQYDYRAASISLSKRWMFSSLQYERRVGLHSVIFTKRLRSSPTRSNVHLITFSLVSHFGCDVKLEWRVSAVSPAICGVTDEPKRSHCEQQLKPDWIFMQTVDLITTLSPDSAVPLCSLKRFFASFISLFGFPAHHSATRLQRNANVAAPCLLDV